MMNLFDSEDLIFNMEEFANKAHHQALPGEVKVFDALNVENDCEGESVYPNRCPFYCRIEQILQQKYLSMAFPLCYRHQSFH